MSCVIVWMPLSIHGLFESQMERGLEAGFNLPAGSSLEGPQEITFGFCPTTSTVPRTGCVMTPYWL